MSILVTEEQHPHDGAIYPDHRSQAIVRGVWNLTAEEIGANLQFIVKRRASVREFMNLLNTEHGWKHRIALPRDKQFDITYHDCTHTSLVVKDWDTHVILSFRRFKNCPLRFVLVRPFIIMDEDQRRRHDYNFFDIKTLVESIPLELPKGAQNAAI